MDDEWMFEVLGAVGARLERGAGDELLLRYVFPADVPTSPAADGFPVEQSADVVVGAPVEEIADVVERRLSRHFDVKRVTDTEGSGLVRSWALTERSASPGLDQPVT